MKILIAEDNDVFRDLLAEVLIEAGYEVAAEMNGLLAWERLQAEGADMAVLDVNMPEMDGFELLKHIRRDGRFKKMPVLMLTVMTQAKDQVRGYETGADDYLPKPFNNDILLARMKVLERRILNK
ncbi:MAG: response regulator transcription factor [Elusimicrobiota bacterium]